MEQASLTKKDLIPHLGSRSRVSEILAGKRDLTLGMIRALNAHLGIPAEAIRWLVARVGGFKAVPQFALRISETPRLNANFDRHALLGWILQALREGMESGVPARFDPRILTDKFVATLVSLSVTNDSPRQARSCLAQAGISLIAVPHLRRTYLDGAVFLLDKNRPIIALSLRYDRLDNFWFVLLHELAHLARGHLSGANPWIVDDLDLPHHDSEQEVEADRYAARALLPEDFDLDQRESISAAAVTQYARERGIHPAIVARRIRHARKNYRILTSLIGNGAVRQGNHAGTSLQFRAYCSRRGRARYSSAVRPV